MSDDLELIDALLALYLLTDGDLHDPVPVSQLQVEVTPRGPLTDSLILRLVDKGLAIVVPIDWE